MSRRGKQARGRRLRQEAVRTAAGPWTLWAAPARARQGRLTVALGRRAGGATVRSRTRRIARDVLTPRHDASRGIDFVLLARADVSTLPRRQVRVALARLLRHALVLLARREKGASRV